MVDYHAARQRFLDQLVEHHKTVPRPLLDAALELMICLNCVQHETSIERAKRTGLEAWARKIRGGDEPPEDTSWFR